MRVHVAAEMVTVRRKSRGCFSPCGFYLSNGCIKGLLLPQSSCKVGSPPSRTQAKPSICPCSCERSLLLQQSVSKLPVGVASSMVAKSFLFRVASALPPRKLYSASRSFGTGINIQENWSRASSSVRTLVFPMTFWEYCGALAQSRVARKAEHYGTDILRRS